jgi:hypothetical protein
MQKTEVIKYFGGKQKDVVTALNNLTVTGVSKGTISLWPERVPECWAAKIHVLTNGDLKYKPYEYK